MTTSRPTIEQQYAAARPKSRALYERARRLMPSGAAHDGRYFAPFPFYVDRADGARKWDVDGHEYLDCWSGHGALMLGHNHPAAQADATPSDLYPPRVETETARESSR